MPNKDSIVTMTQFKTRWLWPLILAGLILGALVANFDRLLLHPTTTLPGTPDAGAFNLLHLWWPVASLAHADEPVIHSFIGAPYLTNHLRNMPMAQSVLFTALKGLGPVLAFNLLLVLSQVASQLAIYWFIQRKGVAWFWAALAATVFVLSPWYSDLIAQADLISASWWLPPLALIAWDRWFEKPSYGRAIAVMLVLYLAVLCGVQNVLWVVVLWLPYAGWQTWRRWRTQQLGAAQRDHLTLMVLGFLVLFLIYPTPVLVRTLMGNEPAYGPALTTPVLRSFIGWAIRVSPAVLALMGLTVLLAPPGNHRWRWLCVAALGIIIGVGVMPDPLQMAASALGLPYNPLADRDFFFGPALFAILMYATQTWQAVWQTGTYPLRWAGVWLSALLLGLGTNSDTWHALPTTAVNVPAFYPSIAAEPEDYIVLDYPFGLNDVSEEAVLGKAAYLARYSVWDDKRSMSGLAPYYSARVFEKASETSFLFPDSVTDATRDETAQALGTATREWRIGYVVVHPELLSDQIQTIIQDLAQRSDSLCPPTNQDGLIIYRAKWHPYGCPTP